jgi:hypothetical protein
MQDPSMCLEFQSTVIYVANVWTKKHCNRFIYIYPAKLIDDSEVINAQLCVPKSFIKWRYSKSEIIHLFI